MIKVSTEYYTGIIHGIKLVTFFKDVSNDPLPTKDTENRREKSKHLETLQE